MTEQSTMGEKSLHFAGVWLGAGDDKGREMMGVRLNNGKEVVIRVTSTGRISSITLDGKKLS